MIASIDRLKSRHLLNHWLSNSPNSFNGLRWAVEIGRIGEPTVLGAWEERRSRMSYRSDGSNSQQSDRLQCFSKGDFDPSDEGRAKGQILLFFMKKKQMHEHNSKT
jgi:hypothetical protein